MPAKRRKSQRNGNASGPQAGSAPGWAWMLFGLSIGLAVALVVWLRSGDPETVRVPASIAAVGDRLRAASAAPEPALAADPPAASTLQPANAPADADESEAVAAAEPGRVSDDLSFYEALSAAGVEIPASELDTRAAEPDPGRYMIQAGSFRTFEEADGRRARLALLALDAEIRRATVNGVLYHRVMIGPLSERGQINRSLRQLRDARIEHILLTVSD